MGHSQAAAALCNWVKAVDKYIKEKQNYLDPNQIRKSTKLSNSKSDKSVLGSELKPMESSRQKKFEHITNLKESIR